ncbi:MAG: ATP-binding cassette domain-containing protein [Ilumatobacteraceae bacterium]
MTTPLLQIVGASKRFGAVQALFDVDFEVDVGEVVALVGDNGAGKSTLVKAIAGTSPPDTGTVYFDGKPVTINSPKEATDIGIATVYQDLALCDNLDVVANLFLGRESTKGGLLDEAAMEHAAEEVMSRLSVRIPSLRTQVAALSGGQRQSVAVARATLGNPRIVMLDEPTAALGVSQTKEVLELIRTLRAQQLGVVVISHNLSDIFAVSDRIIVLRLGRRVATFHTAQTTTDAVVAAITSGVAEDQAEDAA